MIPFNAWGAYILGLLAVNGISNPFVTLFDSYIFNFYPILTIALLIVLVLCGKDFGPMKKSMRRVENEGKLFRDGARPLVSSEITSIKKKEHIPARSFNMLIPIISMVLLMPVTLIYNGWNKSTFLQDMILIEKLQAINKKCLGF